MNNMYLAKQVGDKICFIALPVWHQLSSDDKASARMRVRSADFVIEGGYVVRKNRFDGKVMEPRRKVTLRDWWRGYIEV